MAADDEIWQPGYDGPPPVSGMVSPDSPRFREGHASTKGGAPAESTTSADRAVPLSPRVGRGRTVAVASVVFALAVGALIARSLGEDDLTAGVSSATLEPAVVSAELTEPGVVPLVVEPFAGADPRRLPLSVDELWRTDLTGVTASDRTRLSVLSDGAVVGLFDDADVDVADDDAVDDVDASSVLVLLDGADGTQRWSRSFTAEARAFDVLGDADGVIVVERRGSEGRAALGISVESGAVWWVHQTDGTVAYALLDGTDLVLRLSAGADAVLTFIDPRTGSEVGRVPGSLVATDHLGTWYVSDGATLSALDLRDGWKAPVPLEPLWVRGGEPVSVVDGRVVVIDDGILQVRGDGGYPAPVAILGAGELAGLDADTHFSQLVPMVGDSFVLVGSRSAYGAAFDENGDADIRWRASGTPIDSRPTDRGLSLILATDGGGFQRVVDASTGREIAIVEMMPGSIDTLALVGNGVLVKRSARLGVERVGLDLDGNRLWSLVGDGPVAIGRGVVATFRPSDGGVAVTALGESP